MKMNIVEMETLGVADYYLDLSKFIHNFVNKNYPLTEDDMRAIINDVETLNIRERNEILNVMLDSLNNILLRKAKENLDFIKATYQCKDVKPITMEMQREEIFKYSQEILENLWIYRQSKNGVDGMIKR